MMTRILIVVVSIVTMLPELFAQKYEYFQLDNFSKFSNERNRISPLDARGDAEEESEMRAELNEIKKLPRLARLKMISRAEVKVKDVTVKEPGTLASVLGDDINDIDSLVVRGKINDEDIHTIWSSSFYGVLTVANLEYSQIEGNRLPAYAFHYPEEQYTPEYIKCILLRRIILPEGVEEIGQNAFGYAINLEDINFPSSLRVIARRCFSDCISLNVNPLVIPEGVEEIGMLAFVGCKLLTGKVVLPSTLKIINDGVFFSTKITECNFPEGLEVIGDAAFYGTRLKEVILPNTCQIFTGSDHFGLNYELEKMRFPEGPIKIPSGFVYDCIKLTEFIMPNSVEVIGSGAFWQCGELKELHMPSNLKTIGREGLYYCKWLKTINFPASLETLGAESCENWKRIEKIYCAAKTPPTCINSEVNPGCTPFGSYGDDFVNRTPQDTPVYVPIGSADLYRNAWGWNYFTNFIETDDFPVAGVDEVLISKKEEDSATYDLLGRKVKHLTPGEIYIRNGQKFVAK